MPQNFKSRRGMTLAELMVALALVAVMIVMVVSFALLLGEQTQANGENLSIQQDRAMLKSGVEAWFSAVTGENATISLKAANPTTMITETAAGLDIVRHGSDSVGCAVLAERAGADKLSLSFAYGVLKGQMPDGDTVTIHAQNIKSVMFYLVKKEPVGAGAEYLLYCVCTDTQGTYTFCLNPREGEKGGAFG